MTEGTKTEGKISGVALAVAVIVILAWLAMIVWLITQRGEQEVVWSRLLFLLGSLEAVAFGAAGALFGTQIQRQRVADAKERATKAEGEAAANQSAATKGRALAALVKAEGTQGAQGALPRKLGTDAGDRGSPSASLALAEEILSDRDG